MDYSKKYIKSWFLENNPTFEPNIEDIYLEIEDQLEGLKPQGCRIVLSSFLALNYSNKYIEKVEMALYDDYSDIVNGWSELGIFTSELGSVLVNLERDVIKYPDMPIEDLIKSSIESHMLMYEKEVDPFIQSIREDSKLNKED